MKSLERALNELYIASESPEEAQNRIETAIEYLEDSIEELGPKMVSEELIELIQTLSAGGDIDPVIYELEVFNNEF